MAVSVVLYLFGKLEEELGEGGVVTPQRLRALGDELRRRLRAAADVVGRLTWAGWEAEVGPYDLLLTRPGVTGATQAARLLRDLGVDPEGLLLG
jgi:hypothetical protein